MLVPFSMVAIGIRRWLVNLIAGWLLVCGGLVFYVKAETCPEVKKQMAVCLHTYLERDFTGLEPFLDFSVRTDRWKVLINGPELESVCSKLDEMVNCYAALDGQCHDTRARERFSYLIDTLYRLYYWLCDSNKRLKALLENIACIIRSQHELPCQYSVMPVNIWQQMLRLESGPETCRPFQWQLACMKRTGRIQHACGNRSHEIYVHGMEIWLDGWCFDQDIATSGFSISSQGLIISVFFGVLHWLWLLLKEVFM